jgi:hypothetical protein
MLSPVQAKARQTAPGPRAAPRALAACLLTVALLAGCSQGRNLSPAPLAPQRRPDLSGFWNLDMRVARDPGLMSKVAPDTVLLDDTGPAELPAGNYGGLELTPAAVEKARRWNPREQLTLANACRPPSIVYAMQGPFPIEIFQSDVFIVIKLEYYDLVRIVFLDGRTAQPDYPHSMTGFSRGHWEGSTLVVETDHLEAATITNNGLDHTEHVRVLERFRLSPDSRSLLATQEFADPEVIENRGVRFIAWTRERGQHVFPYECDPNFAGNYSQGSVK